MSGPRKQRYVLDIDDVVRRGLMTRNNADELIAGLNTSETEKQVAVVVGGTNNNSFIDNELIIYDAINKRFASSGYTPQTIGLASVFVPYITGVSFNNAGVDLTNNASDSITLVNQSFTLPPNAFWVELDLTFGFQIAGADSSMTGLAVYFGSDPGAAVSILTTYPGPYVIVDESDSAWVSWKATGSIPLAHILDDPLTVTIKGIPQDVATCRSCLTKMGYRHSVAPPVGGGAKGVPVFFTVPVIVPVVIDGIWKTFDISSYVPAGASAVILQFFCSIHKDRDATVTFYVRKDSTSFQFIGLRAENENNDSRSGGASQGLFPFKSEADVRSFDYLVSIGGSTEGTQEIKLVGYIT